MGIISSLENMAKNAMGYSQLKSQAGGIKSLAAALTMSQRSSIGKESFEEALIRLNLTPQDIEAREREFTRLVKIFSVLALIVLLYFIYAVIIQKALIVSLGSLGIFFFVSAQLFRYHFWLFQIRQRRLGCTFKEWLRALMGKKV